MVKRDYHEVVLDNGLKVGIERTDGETFAMALRIKHAACDEKPEEQGVAHFLEHVLANEGSVNMSPEEFGRFKEKVGGFNASTSFDKTRYIVGSLVEDLDESLRVVKDIVFNPSFNVEIIERERQRVIREINDRRCNPVRKRQEFATMTLHSERDPRRRPSDVGGEQAFIESAGRNELKDFHARGYSPNNADLVLVGGFGDDVEKLVRNYFESLPRGSVRKTELLPLQGPIGKNVGYFPEPHLANTVAEKENMDKLDIHLPGPKIVEEDYPAFYVLENILGGGGSSRLFNRVSNQLGLAYYINSNHSSGKDHGSMSVHASVKSSALELALSSIFEEFGKIRDTKVNEREVEVTIRKLRYGVASSAQMINERMRKIQCLWDDGISQEEVTKRIRHVTAEDVQRVAQKYLPASRNEGNYLLVVGSPAIKEGYTQVQGQPYNPQ